MTIPSPAAPPVVRTLTAMSQAPWTLEPALASTPDPDCPHCAHGPGYPHRHWRQAEQPDPGPNWMWRTLFRIYGDGGTR